MDEHTRDKVTSMTSPRYYPSVQCLLPADQEEAARSDAQHLIIVQAFENWLSLAPLKLVAGDKVQQEVEYGHSNSPLRTIQTASRWT
ncbi:hypothetical protein LENED_004185 [Lentinula edodes]|uniref:Uncharacterized protein n=1 Tax=Lentinula edodes TaxID=5353 RepID=A0A1Q3E5K5_LENED|nr:hypothetical protein LENED_004185 [Lentinula edodes]